MGVAQLAGEVECLLVFAQLVRYLGAVEVGDHGGAVALGERIGRGVEPLLGAGEVAGSTSNAPDVEPRAPGPDRVGVAIEQGASQGRGEGDVVAGSGPADVEVEGEIGQLGLPGGIGEAPRDGDAWRAFLGRGLEGLLQRDGCGWRGHLRGGRATRGHNQHGSPPRRSVPHDGYPRVPRALDCGNLTREGTARTMPGVLATAADAIARIAAARAEIAAAAGRAGRDPEAVRIVAVTKTLPPAAVDAALDGGIADIGENYVQEAVQKRSAVSRAAAWHLIGGLQRNKVSVAVRTFDWVHTVDSDRLAVALAGAAASAGRRLPVLIQVNLSGAEGQRGAPPEAAETLARTIAGLSPLDLQGVMTIAPAAAAGEVRRAHFRQARELRDHVAQRLGVELPHLSMGMSDDFSLAVEEGATLVRLGRALFGPRGPRSWREGA